MRTCFILFVFCCCSQWLSAQKIQPQDSIVRVATIKHQVEGNAIQLSPETPPLEQAAGAPKAYYSYYWEFDDGTYSKEKNPKHVYKTPGDYEVKLWATNHYDTGKPPSTRPKKISVTQTDNSIQDEASMSADIMLERNREPMPEENIVVIMRYKNYLNYTTSGKLYLFYNEKKHKDDTFIIEDMRTYHNEKQVSLSDFAFTNTIDESERTFLASAENGLLNLKAKPQDSTIKTNLPLTLEDSKANYRNSEQLEFNNMEPNEERNLFFTLKTPPEMLKDTSAIISIRGVYVPDSNYDNHKVKDMEMEIVTSHDPNKMASNGTFMNYRLIRFKTLKYKIKFQNNGEGPANTIRLETDIPEMLDKSTIEVIDMYPECKICPKNIEVSYSCLDTTFTDTQAIFTFKNIYLPGSEQKIVQDIDSTKGFVRYKIKFAKDFHKKKTKSRTAIIFDNNDPILTNYSTTRFVPGLSIGAKVGYNMFSDLKTSESYFVGATISPYKSYRLYWQVELLNSFHNYTTETEITNAIISDVQGFQYLQRTTRDASYENIEWEIPILMRYNINNYIGVGAGIQGMLTISEKETENLLIEEFEGTSDLVIDSSTEFNENSNSFTNFKAGLLLDVTAGFARIGPSIGARYVLNFEDDFNYLQLYAIWKF